ncbi:MAG: DHH family phosphoesterase [Thermoplasmata archaeon]|nr:DHH family phosphoesterase [Thermoplasmata archaeon]
MNSDLENIRSALQKGSNNYFLHSNADMDCVGSAAALAIHFGNYKIYAPAGVSHLGKRLLVALNIEPITEMTFPDTGNIVVVDAQDDSSIGYPGIDWDRAIIIDHHKARVDCSGLHIIREEETSSCAEIIWRIIGQPEKLAREIGRCLMAGILADTGHLKRGSYKTLAATAEILKASELSMEDVLIVFESADDQDISRRVSRLKGVQRMKFERVGEWVVATSEIGAFESAVCQALLSIGADIAFAGSQNGDDFRITGRANRMAIGAGIHLGDMLNKMANEISGEGGGHDGAAGFSGKGNIEAMLDICFHNSMASLKGHSRATQGHNKIKENVL